MSYNNYVDPNSVMFIDVETIPDNRPEAIAYNAPPFPEEDFLTGEQIAAANAGDAASYINKYAYALSTNTDEDGNPWLTAYAEAEEANKKPRVTVLRAIEDAWGAEAQWKLEHSVDPELAKIITLAWAIGEGPVQAYTVGQMVVNDRYPDGFVVTEKILLDAFWHRASEISPQEKKFVGYNVMFDLSMLYARSMMMGIYPTINLNMAIEGAAWKQRLIDIAQFRWPRGASGKYKKFKDLAKLWGIEPLKPDTDGANVYDMYQAGDFTGISEYCASDVDLSRRMAKKMGGASQMGGFLPYLGLTPLEDSGESYMLPSGGDKVVVESSVEDEEEAF